MLCSLFQGGMYWLVLLDDYSASFGLMVVVITTCLAVTRVYGEKGWGLGMGRQADTPQSERTGCGPYSSHPWRRAHRHWWDLSRGHRFSSPVQASRGSAETST